MKKRAIGVVGCGVAVVGAAVVVALVGFLFWWLTYNRLVRLDEAVKSAWGQVENVYQRRADLVPNLVETVKGARDFERETLTGVVEARAKVGQVSFQGVPDATQLERFQQAQDGLTSALSRLLVVVERYPELRATESFLTLQAQLEGTENRIAVERRRYNEAAQAFNSARRGFFTSFVASHYDFGAKPYFEAAPGAETAPKVEL